MNEPQLADLLENYLDTFLEGEELAEAPAEIVQFLAVAQELADIAPTPRPEFGPALKASLLNPTIPGDGGASGLPGTTWGSGKVVLMAVVGLAVLATTLAILFGVVRRDDASSEVQEEPTTINTPALLEEAAPTTPPTFLPPTLTPASTIAPTATSTAEPIMPSPVATMIIDTLPPLTMTIEPAEDSTLPIDMVPGLAPPETDGGSSGGDGGGGGGNGGGNGGGGSGDDHDRGHGNDPGRRDPDNPGKKP